MARCCCSSRVFCLCLLPCMMMGHLLIYILVSIFVTISYNSSQAPPPQLPLHFVAPGASKNSVSVASHPLSPFWNLRLQDGALWNRLQHQLDRQHNPILRPAGNRTVGRGANGATGQGAEASSVVCGLRPQWSSQLPGFKEMPQQMKDFVLSMNCRSYPLLIDQPHLCEREWGAEAPLLLMAIKSQVCIL